MSNVHVVYANISNLNDEPEWHALGVDSIDAAEAIAPMREGEVTLLGTSHPRRAVAVYRANSNCRNPRGWRNTGTRHFMLARFFMRKLQDAPLDAFGLAPFFDEIDDAAARHAAQQLVALKCGVNVPDVDFGDMHRAILEVNNELSALGVPSGDWTFDPIKRAFREISK